MIENNTELRTYLHVRKKKFQNVTWQQPVDPNLWQKPDPIIESQIGQKYFTRTHLWGACRVGENSSECWDNYDKAEIWIIDPAGRPSQPKSWVEVVGCIVERLAPTVQLASFTHKKIPSNQETPEQDWLDGNFFIVLVCVYPLCTCVLNLFFVGAIQATTPQCLDIHE